MNSVVERYRGSLKSPTELTGIYRARVEDNRDPLNIGRVKIRVPMLHGFDNEGISNKNLPWASYCSMSGGYQYGTFIIPEIGEYVFVMFEDGDSNKPIYLGSCYGTGSSTNKKYGSDTGTGVWYGKKGENEVPVEAQRKDPTKKIVYRSPKGSLIEIDDDNDAESVVIEDAKGQTLRLETLGSDGNSRIVLKAEGDQRIELETGKDGIRIYIGDGGSNAITITPNGDGITLCSDKSVKLSAPGVSVKGDVTVNGDALLTGNVTVVEK